MAANGNAFPSPGASAPSRRRFLKGAGLVSLGALAGMAIPFRKFMPPGYVPLALAQTDLLAGKRGLSLLNDRPVNAETPPHLLDDEITPAEVHFVRNNGLVPDNLDAEGWRLTVDGEVERPLSLSIEDLKRGFEVVSLALVIECGGNGRAGFKPPATGNQWTYGAVGCSRWTGVRLTDVLNKAGLKPSAVYTGHEGADLHLSGDPAKLPISRGVPIEKALKPHNLIAFAQNGRPIHPLNGAPLRLVIPGWPGSCSQKWLTRIWVRDREHDGAKMTGTSYRVPKYPVAPGEDVPVEDFAIIESMPVKSLITFPQTGIQTAASEIEVRGHAWAGDNKVSQMFVSNDFGATWQLAELAEPVNRYAWQRWRAVVALPEQGYFEIWVRAVDDTGKSQPFAIAWNPKGYLNNSFHKIAVVRT